MPSHSDQGTTARPSTLHRLDSDFVGTSPFQDPPNESQPSIELTNFDQENLELGTPKDEQDGLAPMSARNPPKNMWRIIASVLWSFSGGLSDAAPGALLPHIEDYYHIDYAVLSLIWISNAVGFILIATLSHKIQSVLGRRNSMTLGCILACIMYVLIIPGTKFAVVVIGFFVGGCGTAINLSQTNIFISNVDPVYLAYLHGSYGIGATVSPLLATSMVNRGVKWCYFYALLLGIMACHAINLFLAFDGSAEDLKPWDEPAESAELTPEEKKREDTENMKSALKTCVTWLLSFFVLFYQGAEVSLGGWIVTFLLDYRKGNSNLVGYVASGFWGGLTVGRLFLTAPLHNTLGPRKSVTLLSIVSLIFVALTWAVPNVIVAAVFISIAGLFIGPNYPLMITYATRKGLIPRKIQVVVLTITTAFGSSGGAIFPFLIGLLSQVSGTYVVMPMFIALYALMLALWIIMPNMDRVGKTTLWERIW